MSKSLKRFIKTASSIIYQVCVGTALFITMSAVYGLLFMIPIAVGLIFSILIAALIEAIVAASFAAFISCFSILFTGILGAFFSAALLQFNLMILSFAAVAGIIFVQYVHSSVGLDNYVTSIFNDVANTPESGNYSFLRKMALRILLLLGADINHDCSTLTHLANYIYTDNKEKLKFLMKQGVRLFPGPKPEDMSYEEYDNLLDQSPLICRGHEVLEDYSRRANRLKEVYTEISGEPVVIPATLLRRSLYNAINCNNLDLALFLIEQGAELLPARPAGMDDVAYTRFAPLACAFDATARGYGYDYNQVPDGNGRQPIEMFQRLLKAYRESNPDKPPYLGAGLIPSAVIQKGLKKAMEAKNLNLAQLLIEHYNADINEPKGSLHRELEHALNQRNIKLIKMLIEANTTPEGTLKNDISQRLVQEILIKAIGAREHNLVKLLVRHYGADISVGHQSYSGLNSAVFFVMLNKDEAQESVELLELYESLHPENPKLPLMRAKALENAIYIKDHALIKRLIKNQADINLKFSRDYGYERKVISCLLWAFELGNIQVVKTVIDSYCELHPEISTVVQFSMLKNNEEL